MASDRLDFLVFDHLAKLIMSLLVSARMKSAELGYATDFASVVMRTVLKDVLAQNIRITINAGGVNPCRRAAALQALATELGMNVCIIVTEGDDVMVLLLALRGESVRELRNTHPLPNEVVSTNTYLSAPPVKTVLGTGAQVVIIDRCVDSTVTPGASMHTFERRADGCDWLAADSLVGHILECGRQSADGLHTGWRAVPGWAYSGYLIAKCQADGNFIVTKPDGTGRLVTTAAVGE